MFNLKIASSTTDLAATAVLFVNDVSSFFGERLPFNPRFTESIGRSVWVACLEVIAERLVPLSRCWLLALSNPWEFTLGRLIDNLRW